MALDGKLLASARDVLADRRQRNQAENERRSSEIAALIPETVEIDRALRINARSAVVLFTEKDPNVLQRIRELSEDSAALRDRKVTLLTENGYAPDYLEPIYSCSRCNDKGYLENGSMCTCLLAEYEDQRKKEMTSLLRTSDDSFDTFDLNFYSTEYDPAFKGSPRQQMKLVYDVCREYAFHFTKSSPNLLLRGATGLGKTRLSACIASTVSRRGFSVVYETAWNIFEAFEKQHFARDSGDEVKDAVERFLRCDLLIMDDLGTEMVTSFTQSALYTVINTRLNEGRSTIISTNLRQEEMAHRYLPQTVSRIEGEFDELAFVGTDIRLLRKQQRYS